MIDGIGGRTPLSPLTRATAPVSAAAPAAPVNAEGDRATVSSLGTIVRDMAAGAPVDSAKVDRVRGGLATGSYAVDPAAIAEAMIATDLGG